MEKSNRPLDIQKTTDFKAMRLLALRSGLEESQIYDFVVAYGCFEENEMIGCAGLNNVNGIFTVDCLAVRETHRSKGIGTALVKKIELEAQARGARMLWAVARAPGFFLKLGFEIADPEGADRPSMKGCLTCPQYRKECNPSMVFKRVQAFPDASRPA